MTKDPKDMTDAEREAHIHDCGRLMLEAMAANNRQEAEGWLQAQNMAIASRSPAQVQRMEAERGLLSEPCFFVGAGDAARAALQGRQAA